HPHVFGDVAVSGAEEVVANWEVIKRDEKGRASLMDGVSRDLPSLLYAHKLYRKAGSVGLSFGTADEARRRVDEALAGAALGEAEERLGEALAAVVLLARLAGVDGESALRGWAGRFKARFQTMEARAAERGERLESMDPAAVAALWKQVVGTS